MCGSQDMAKHDGGNSESSRQESGISPHFIDCKISLLPVIMECMQTRGGTYETP